MSSINTLLLCVSLLIGVATSFYYPTRSASVKGVSEGAAISNRGLAAGKSVVAGRGTGRGSKANGGSSSYLSSNNYGQSAGGNQYVAASGRSAQGLIASGVKTRSRTGSVNAAGFSKGQAYGSGSKVLASGSQYANDNGRYKNGGASQNTKAIGGKYGGSVATQSGTSANSDGQFGWAKGQTATKTSAAGRGSFSASKERVSTSNGPYGQSSHGENRAVAYGSNRAAVQQGMNLKASNRGRAW